MALLFVKYPANDSRYSPQTFTKQPSEKYPASVDFTAVMESEATLTAASCTVTAVDSAGDDASSTVLSGSLSESSGVITQVIQAGTDGERYKITFKAVADTTGHIYEHDVWMNVEAL